MEGTYGNTEMSGSHSYNIIYVNGWACVTKTSLFYYGWSLALKNRTVGNNDVFFIASVYTVGKSRRVKTFVFWSHYFETLSNRICIVNLPRDKQKNGPFVLVIVSFCISFVFPPMLPLCLGCFHKRKARLIQSIELDYDLWCSLGS